MQRTIRETVNTTGISNPDAALAIDEPRVTVRIDVVDCELSRRRLADDLGEWLAGRMTQR